MVSLQGVVVSGSWVARVVPSVQVVSRDPLLGTGADGAIVSEVVQVVSMDESGGVVGCGGADDGALLRASVVGRALVVSTNDVEFTGGNGAEVDGDEMPVVPSVSLVEGTPGPVVEPDGWPVGPLKVVEFPAGNVGELERVGLGPVTVITTDAGIVTVVIMVEVDLALLAVLERLESNPALEDGSAPVELSTGPPVPGSQPLGCVPPQDTVEFGRGKGGADELRVIVGDDVASLVVGTGVVTGSGPVPDGDGIGLDRTEDRLDDPVPKPGEEV
ncbi:hypothetical protein C8A03DRAFT_29781 [Achaetomium macrosporum]|uniref:Uncharacterized protein n=1 Tax=Achaetomium macrosporum TaxID=79813 RepID=A0AAN7CH66_9PEZI|nr:hypothetical protein C8A03DRAFT_29781 [Achaetomium macrosporum]